MLGTTLGKCIQSRWRTDRAERMGAHMEMLVNSLCAQIVDVCPLPSMAEEQYSSLWGAWLCGAGHCTTKRNNTLKAF